MKSFEAFLEEGKIVDDGDVIIVTVPKAVADEVQIATFETSDTDYGEKQGNKLHLYKSELKSLADRWKYDYDLHSGLEDVKPALKRKMQELSKTILKYA
jgi:hypothetical protein